MMTVFLPVDRFVGRLASNIVSASRCAELLADLDARGFARTGELYPRDYRNNDRLVFDDPQLATELCELLREHVPDEIVDAGASWKLIGFNARFRACRYANGQSFCIHRDGAYVPSEDRRSFLTVQLYLDDDPHRVGGRTRFYADPQGRESWAAIAPAAGSVIIFDHRAWHDGEAVTAGIKHVLRTDAVYERADLVALDEPDVIRRHRGYAWRAIACRDGSIASAGRDGTVRRSDVVHDLRDGSITTLIESSDGSLWCGSRAGSIHRLASDATSVAGDLGAVVGSATSDALAGSSTRIVSDATSVAGDLGAVMGSATSVALAGSNTRIAHDTRVARELGAVLASATSGALVAFSTARGQVIAFGDRLLWKIDAHDGWARGLCAHRDGFATCGDDGRVVVVDSHSRAREHAQLSSPLRAIISDGAHLHIGDDRGWIHTLAHDGSTLRSRRAHAAAVTSLALLDGDIVSAGEDGFVKRGATVLAHLPDVVTSVVATPRGFVVAGYDGAVRLVG